MTTTHNTAAAPGMWPPPAAHADADLSDADWGAINREDLAEKLCKTYWGEDDLGGFTKFAAVRADWLAVADAAVAEILGVVS